MATKRWTVTHAVEAVDRAGEVTTTAGVEIVPPVGPALMTRVLEYAFEHTEGSGAGFAPRGDRINGAFPVAVYFTELDTVLTMTFGGDSTRSVLGWTGTGAGAAALREPWKAFLPRMTAALQEALDEWERDLEVLDEHMIPLLTDVIGPTAGRVLAVEEMIFRRSQELQDAQHSLFMRVGALAGEMAALDASHDNRLRALERLHAAEAPAPRWWQRQEPVLLTLAKVIGAAALGFGISIIF